LVAGGFAVLAALAAGLAAWALVSRRRARRRVAVLTARLAALDRTASAAETAAEAFDTALILIEDGAPSLLAGVDSLANCARALGLDPAATSQAVIDALSRIDPGHARRLAALASEGEAFAFEARSRDGGVSVEGRSTGALAWLRLRAVGPVAAGRPTAARLAAFIDARRDPAWITTADSAPVWANQAWLAAVSAASLEEAKTKGVILDRTIDTLAREAATLGETREILRWVSLPRGRCALRVTALPLEGGGVGVWTDDVTQGETAAFDLKRHTSAHDLTLNQIGDAVVVFGPDRRLLFHNTAFARLWELEPAWLADCPSHAEILDRLRQRRGLPETVDYARFKAGELARYEQLAPSGEAIWRLPRERTLRVVGQPHPLGGLLMLFSDITPELRLKTQFNHLLQVQQATLDKLTDAVAVFGSDARLKLHNEAFERFWAITPDQIAQAADFDGVVDLCVRRLHDMHFWRELKGRITDPDPRARAPVSGEAQTADGRIMAYQCRPLPDGATLISFADVTDTRRLEGALQDRETALAEAERLKREFVGSVSYELRTPLTTIIGYAELLEREANGLGERERGYVGAVRAAAIQLARSINNVLDMAELDAGETTLEPGDLDVATLLAEAAGRWAAEASEGGVSIHVAPEAGPGLIRGDARRLGDVLDHLVGNALRHTPPEGTIRLSADRGLGEVRLQVSDTGRGIPFHVQAHIFDRFSGEDHGGQGLGLALVKALVELHGGWVALESEPGAGATFACHLPEAAQ
jgi:signal transduction histidine kinase